MAVQLIITLEITATDLDDASSKVDTVKAQIDQAGWVCEQRNRIEEYITHQ